MSLIVSTTRPKKVSKWCEYKDAEGNVLAEIKVRGISYGAYQSALETINTVMAQKSKKIEDAKEEDKLFHELLLDAAACHLIEDWSGVSVVKKDAEGNIVYNEDGTPKTVDLPYTPENAKNILNNGDIGPVIWLFVKTNAEEIQREADGIKAEVLGKSENSMNGQKSEVKSKPAATRKSRTTSAKQTQ